MCFFKKKKKVSKKYPENALYKIGDFVHFKYRDSLSHGLIYNARLDEEGNVIYTIQIGGECPTLIENMNESKIINMNK